PRRREPPGMQSGHGSPSSTPTGSSAQTSPRSWNSCARAGCSRPPERSSVPCSEARRDPRPGGPGHGRAACRECRPGRDMSALRKGGSAPTGPGAEDQLRQLTKGFEQILEISPTAIVFTDLANRIASWNPAAERLFGYSPEEASGRDLDDLVASTDVLHAEAVRFRQRVAASEHVRTISRRTRKDGSLVDVELLA